MKLNHIEDVLIFSLYSPGLKRVEWTFFLHERVSIQLSIFRILFIQGLLNLMLAEHRETLRKIWKRHCSHLKTRCSFWSQPRIRLRLNFAWSLFIILRDFFAIYPHTLSCFYWLVEAKWLHTVLRIPQSSFHVAFFACASLPGDETVPLRVLHDRKRSTSVTGERWWETAFTFHWENKSVCACLTYVTDTANTFLWFRTPWAHLAPGPTRRQLCHTQLALSLTEPSGRLMGGLLELYALPSQKMSLLGKICGTMSILCRVPIPL